MAQIYLRRADGTQVWLLSTRGATSPVTFRIPALPSTADREALLGTESLDAVPNVCVIDAASQPGFCSRAAGGRAVGATP